MADTTPTTPIKVGPIATKPSGYHTNTIHGSGEIASSTWKKGAFVSFDATNTSTGRVQECAAPLTSATPTTSITAGIAQSAATGTTDKEVMIDDVERCYVEITLSHTAGSHTLALADVGNIYTISRDSVSKNWYLQDVATTEALGGGYIVQLKDPIGTVDGRVFIRVTRNVIQGA